MDEDVEAAVMRAGAQIEALQRENATLRKDADRYRWLRQYGNGIYADVFNDEDVPILAVPAAACRLDTAIDAAMAAMPAVGAA